MTNPALWITVMVIVAAGTVALIRFGYFAENVLRKKHPTWVGHLPVTLPDPPKPRTILRSKAPAKEPKSPKGVGRQCKPGAWISFKNDALFSRFSLSEQKV